MIEPAGDIKEMTIPWLFQGLRKEKQSGAIIFARGQAVKKIYVKCGEIISADSNLDDDQLSACLLREGKITRQYYDAANEIVQKTGKAAPAVLVEYEFLSPQDLVAGFRLRAKQIILSVFGWRDGRYIFDNGPLPRDIIPLPMNTGELIVEGIRGLDWQIVRKSLPSLKTVLRPSSDPSLIVQNAGLEQDCHTVLSLIDGRRSIEELCSQSGIGDFNTLKAVYLLLALAVVDQGAVKTEAEMKASRSAVRDAAPAKEQKSSEQPSAAAAQADQTPVSIEAIEQAHAALQHQDNYQVLGISSSAAPGEIKKAYFKLAKAYHPDRHLNPEMAVLKEKLEALFTALHGAYQTLSDPAKRQEYDAVRAGPQGAAEYEEKKRPEEYVENYAEKTVRAAAYFKTGMTDFKIGNYWGAAESFAWATRLDPVNADYFYQYGISLTRIPRRRHEAEENLRKAIEIYPLKPEYYLELGTLYLRSGLKAKALEVYHNALRQIPGSNELREAIKAAGGTVQEKKEDVQK